MQLQYVVVAPVSRRVVVLTSFQKLGFHPEVRTDVIGRVDSRLSISNAGRELPAVLHLQEATYGGPDDRCCNDQGST